MNTGGFSSSCEVMHYNANDNKLWEMGDVPQDEQDWLELSLSKITTIVNFSHWPLKRRSGFQIINFSPHIISITMPMTNREMEITEDFNHIINMARSSTRLYVCGEPKYREAFLSILGKKSGIDINIKNTKMTQDEILLVEKYSD
jgi:hypothetical protein